jgi:hypothetical protein
VETQRADRGRAVRHAREAAAGDAATPAAENLTLTRVNL